MRRPFLTEAQARTALANVSEGHCPFNHGPLTPDLREGVGWCPTCSGVEGVEVGYRTIGGDGWTDNLLMAKLEDAR
jgi:hypothetical protein